VQWNLAKDFAVHREVPLRRFRRNVCVEHSDLRERLRLAACLAPRPPFPVGVRFTGRPKDRAGRPAVLCGYRRPAETLYCQKQKTNIILVK